MRRLGTARALAVVGLGAAGLIGGHAVGYAIAVPDVHHRSAFLVDTGHAYLPSASWVAVVLGLAAVVAGLASGYARRRGPAEPMLGRSLVRLAPAQVGAYVALEIFERLAAGAPLTSISLRLAIVGVLAQALVSLLVAMLLVGLRRIGSALAARERGAVLPPVDGVGSPGVRAVPAPQRRSHRTRAPPAALVA